MLADQRGFTMIEMIFVLAITIVLAGFGFVFHEPTVSKEDEIHLLSNMFNDARMKACSLKEKQTVVCEKNALSIYDTHDNTRVKLAEGFEFLTIHQFTYNSNGRIKGAKTIRLKTPDGKISKFVFQLGSGTFYVQS